jgi:hypothetical protein
MHIWRYKGAGTCEQVISIDMPYSPDASWSVRGNGIRGVYGCCLILSTVGTMGTVAVYVVNWLEQTLVVVGITNVSA